MTGRLFTMGCPVFGRAMGYMPTLERMGYGRKRERMGYSRRGAFSKVCAG